jgi:hypothetical protein
MQTFTYTWNDLYPDCILPSCKLPRPHSHILPDQRRIMESQAKYLYAQGGIGSAKSVGFAAKVIDLALSVPGNRLVVSRLHYDDLFDSSWKKIKVILEKLVLRNNMPKPKFSKKIQGDYTEIELVHNGSIIKALQGKNSSRGLGADHGGYWVDDGMESLEEFFVGNETSAGLLSRLRLQEAMWNPQTYDADARPHGSLCGMVSSNPPYVGHWLHKLFGNKPGMHKLGEDTVEWLMLDSSNNPFAGSNYIKGIVASQLKMGKSVETIGRIVRGSSLPAYGGVRVYAEFKHAKHVGRLRYNACLPLITGWDFGYHHPAVVYSNLYRCKYGTNHLVTLSELSEIYSANVVTLQKAHQEHYDARYKDACLTLHAGDIAGFRSNAANKDSRGDGRILEVEHRMAFRKRYVDLDKSLQYVRSLLLKQCECGLQHLLVNTECKVLIAALEGGYKYTKNRQGEVSEKPYKGGHFDDVADAWRYTIENYVRFGVDWQEQQRANNRGSSFYRGRQAVENIPFMDWLESADTVIDPALLIN